MKNIILPVIARRPCLSSGRRSNLKTFVLALALCLFAPPACAGDSEADAPPEPDAPLEFDSAGAPMPAGGAMPAGGGIPDATPGAGIAGSMAPFLSESFRTDLATGAATMSVAITVPPGRKNMRPNLALSYSSNNPNGICGVGWAIPANYIQRSTKDGVPAYDDTDTFIFVSGGSNAGLVKIEEGAYRAKIESAFMKYLYDNTANTWTVYDKTGTKYLFGPSGASRLEEGEKTFGWYLDRVEDVHGNYITYIYEKPADGQIYLKTIEYTGAADLSPDKEIEFVYQERPDKLYSYRSGWKIATTRRLSSIRVNLKGALVWRYELAYETSGDTGRSLLTSITVFDKDGNSLPSKTFTYQQLEE